MNFVPPKLTIASQVTDAHGLVTTLRGDASTYAAPLAPAGLYDIETQRHEVLQLHKLMSQSEGEYVFRTFGESSPNERQVGSTYVFRPWWNPRAWKLVTDRTLTWEHRSYPDDGTHVHCELTYAGIGADEPNTEGYVTGPWWITNDAYQRFVKADEYHCRDDA
jgi:hypothetical protein